MESFRRKIFERDRAAVDLEREDFIFVRGFEVEPVERERVLIVEAEDDILAVARRVEKFIRARAAPQ